MKKKDKTEQKSNYIHAVGRRKTSVARIRLFEGKGKNVIVRKDNSFVDLEKMYPDENDRIIALKPFEALNIKDKYYFSAKIVGGGRTGQLGAISHGLARALAKISEDYRTVLRKEGLLTRDPRMVERKKIYHVKARKSPQYSKR